ncbi:MAG TPA: FAD-binding oxidoreductase [Candidatus Binatia bacterium]
MKSTPDQLAQRLASELGPDAVSFDASRIAAHEVDGNQPALVCTPDQERAGAALRLCAEADASIIPWGGGTAMAVGNPPRHLDVVLDTGRLNRVLDHDHANLTVTAESGIGLAPLQQPLAAQRQFVPLDPPLPDRSTIGGIVAANLNGLRRSCYGSLRDLVIGVKVALISGEQIKAGGKVVKNVAGYDMCKLFTGSLGTLGIITELTLRLAPLPESASITIASGTLAQARQFIGTLFHSRLLPAAVVLSNDGIHNQWRVAVWNEGFEEAVARCGRDLAALAGHAEMNAQFPGGDEHERFWQTVRDFPLQTNRLIYRVTLPRAEIFDFVHLAQKQCDAEILTDILSGTVWLACEPARAAVQRFSDIAALASTRRGHAVIFVAPGYLKQGCEVWGESPSAFPLMRDIKRQFDPKGLLSPGRFLGGI